MGVANKMEADLNASLHSIVEDYSPPDSPLAISHEGFFFNQGARRRRERGGKLLQSSQ